MLTRTLALSVVATATITLVGCEAIKNLTNPQSEPTQVITLRAASSSVPEGGGTVELTATVTLAGAPESGLRVDFETTAGEFEPSASVITDSAGEARTTLRTSTDATVTAKVMAGGVAVVASASQTIGVGGSVAASGEFNLSLSHTPDKIRTDEAVTFLVEARRKDNNNKVGGKLVIEFGDGAKTTLEDFDGKQKVEHTYREASSFNVVVKVTDSAGKSAEGTFSVEVAEGGEMTVRLLASTAEIPARETFEVDVELLRDTGKKGSGKVKVDWGDGRRTNLGQVKGTNRLEHIYRDKGSYRIVADVEDDLGRTARASLRVRVNSPLSIEGALSASDSSPNVGDSVAFTFTATRNDGNPTAGNSTVDFGDGSGTSATVSGSRAVFSHTYSSAGSYTVKVDFDDGAGHSAKASMTVNVSEVVTGGGGGGGGGTGGGGGGSSADELDVGNVVFLHANAGGWAVTSTTTGVTVSPNQICISHTKSGNWPVLDGAEGNPWVVANVGGTWYAATYEWNRPGQACKDLGVPGAAPDTAHSIGPHTKASPLSTWVPKKGEVVYFFASTHGRAGFRTIDERSNLVKVVWPY